MELDGVFDAHTTFHDRNRHNAGIWFSGHRVGGTLRAGDDAVDAAFFALDELPTPLAFDTDERVIEKLRMRIAFAATRTCVDRRGRSDSGAIWQRGRSIVAT